MRRTQSQLNPTEPLAPKPKRKTRKQLEEEAKEREILASMALPEGAVWGTVYGLDGSSRIGIGFVADETQRIVLKEGEGPAEVAGLSLSESITWRDDSDDGTMDTAGMEDDSRAPWPSLELPFGKAPSQTFPSISQTSDAAPQVVQPPSTPPRLAPKGHFIGQPRKGWMPRTPPPTLPISPSFANEHSPNVRAFVGVLKRAQEKDKAVSFDQAKYLSCLEGELTPEPDDDAYGFTQDPGPAGYEKQEALPYSQELLSLALMNALSGRQGSAPAEFPPPQAVHPLAGSALTESSANDVSAPAVVPFTDPSHVADGVAPATGRFTGA